MRTAPPERDCSWQQDAGPALVLPGRPWAVRLAGRDSAFPALEVYEAGVLLDVMSSTQLAAPLLRGGRGSDGRAGPCALAWGRLPSAGASPAVEFTSGRRRPYSRPGTVLKVTSWCWLAVTDGRFDRVAVRCGDRSARGKIHRAKIRRGQP
jgi:hypothetical protein